jgi:type 1 glutamine amidotransferase
VTAPLLIVTEVAPYADGPAGVHGVLGQAEVALTQLGPLAGLEPVVVGSVADLSTGQLLGGGVLGLFTIGETPFTAEQRTLIAESWRSGRLGILGVHAATDACAGWEEYGSLLGGRFAGHPWTRGFDITVADADHPATAHLPDPWTWHDEIYLFRDLHPDARVLLEVAPGLVEEATGQPAPAPGQHGGGAPGGPGLPLAWCLDQGAGRTFYTALGHFPAAWEDTTFLSHLLGGLHWLRRSHDGGSPGIGP